MSARKTQLGRAATPGALMAGLLTAVAAPSAPAATGFGQLSGSGGCLVATGKQASGAAAQCGEGKALDGPSAVAITPDGSNVYVASGRSEPTVAASFGSVAILKRDPTTGAITEIGCLSSDGTDGRDGASGACTPTPSLLGADGVTVSPDGLTVYVAANESASVVAFARDPATGLLTRLGCVQYHPYPGSDCTAANVFPGSGGLVPSADGRALYIASPTLGSLSTLTGALVTPPPTGTTSTSGPTGTSGTAGANPSEASVASIFGIPKPAFVANPCVAVNGYDGSCGFGVATQGLDALALAPGGEQVYAVAPHSNAVDVFAHSPTGMLSESGCLMASPPPGLCAASKLLMSPTALAISPDGKNVYVADSSAGRGRIDVLARDPATGGLSDSSCVEQSPAPEKHEAGEEEKEQEEEPQAAPAPDGCTEVPGMSGVESIAVTGDGSMVYAIGSASAVVLARDPSNGRLSEVSCAASEDSRCTSFSEIGSVQGTAVSADGRNVYVVAPQGNTVFAFGVGMTVSTASASASRAGIARVRVRCPHAMPRACAGRLKLSRVLRSARHGRHRSHVRRLAAGGSGRFALRPGAQAVIAVRLSGGSRELLRERHVLRLIATVRAQPAAGGSGYGRVVKLRLGS